MTTAGPPLDGECDVFVRYLTGVAADPVVRSSYRDAHEQGVLGEPADRFDALLVRWAAAGPVRARWVDGYARFFASGGLLRRKLVLLLALLESRAPSDGLVDRVEPGSRVGFLARMTLEMALFALRLVAAAFVLLPARLALGGREVD